LLHVKLLAMYLYLYDNSLNSNKYHKLLSHIEMRLTDLGIGGKISRLSPLKNLQDLISDEIRFGVKTIVAVGNDETVSMVINNIVNYDNIIFGIIPIGNNNTIADNLGIPQDVLACDVISARRIKKIDLGKVNNTYFISGIDISAENQIMLECENSYNIIPRTHNCVVHIYNLKPKGPENFSNKDFFNPNDGFLEALIQPIHRASHNIFGLAKKSKNITDSVFPFKKISIISKKSITVITDGKKILKPPVQIEVVPNKLTVIIGKPKN